MYTHEGQWIVSADYLKQRLIEIQGTQGALNVLPTNPNPAQDIPAENNPLLDTSIQILANPSKVLYLHYNIADSSVSRSSLASSDQMPGVWVTLSGSGDPYQISLRSEPELLYLIKDVLAVNKLNPVEDLGFDLSSQGALLFMAFLDLNRRQWLSSLLEHREALEIFSRAALEETLANSANNDYRWTLLFTEKQIPLALTDMDLMANLEPALTELLQLGLIEALDENNHTFELTKQGRYLAEIEKQAISKMVLSRLQVLEDQSIGQDIFTLVRGPFDLLLYLLSGANGSLATLNPYELEDILRLVLDIDQRYGEEEDLNLEVETQDRFQSPALKNCPKCQNPAKEEDTYCRFCGNKLK